MKPQKNASESIANAQMTCKNSPSINSGNKSVSIKDSNKSLFECFEIIHHHTLLNTNVEIHFQTLT